MNTLAGLGKLDRKQVTALLRKTQGTITVKEAASILGISQQAAAMRLARWRSSGWLSRIKRGVYIPVPLESMTADIPLEDPWVIAEKLYHPCYMGGWSAGEYWGLTEQIFRTICYQNHTKTKKPSPRHQWKSLYVNHDF